VAVNEVDIDTYLAGTVAAEMSPECPLSFLKAQAVAARSWYFANGGGKHGGLFSHCNDDCCQRYRGTGDLSEQVIRAVTETRGMVLTNSRDEVLNAQYSKCCGGILSMPSQFRGNARPSLWRASRRMARRWLPAAGKPVRVKLDAPASYRVAEFPVSEQNARRWITEAGPDKAGLFCGPKSVPQADLPRYLSRVDEEGSCFRWAVATGQEDLGPVLRTSGGIEDLHIVTALEPLEREPSGRITRLRVQYFDDGRRPRSRVLVGEYAIRRALSRTFLLSSAFVVEASAGRDAASGVFRLQGAGWGHGVGLCQVGALGMALQGYSYENILSHYYENAKLGVSAWAC
jgi:peptidoglycan hydrolase-like amidase